MRKALASVSRVSDLRSMADKPIQVAKTQWKDVVLVCKKCSNKYHHACASKFAFIHQWQRWIPACPACARDLFAGNPQRKLKSSL